MALTHSFNLYSYNTVILMKVYENVFLKLAYMPNYASVFLLTGIAGGLLESIYNYAASTELRINDYRKKLNGNTSLDL